MGNNYFCLYQKKAIAVFSIHARFRHHDHRERKMWHMYLSENAMPSREDTNRYYPHQGRNNYEVFGSSGIFPRKNVYRMKEDPEVKSMEGRIGRNLSVLFGVVNGAIVTHPSPDNGLFLPHIAKMDDMREIVWFDEMGDKIDSIDFGSAQYDEKTKAYKYPGGYAITRKVPKEIPKK